jgi:hypothetical protein
MYRVIGGAALLFAVVGCSADWPEEPIDECGRFTYCDDRTATTKYRPTVTQQPEICLKAYKPKPKPPKPKIGAPDVVETTMITTAVPTTTVAPTTTTTTTTYIPPTTTTSKC